MYEYAEYPQFWELINSGPESVYPHGLCGNRQDHEPHVHESTSLGTFWCHADQTKRLPFAMERKDK